MEATKNFLTSKSIWGVIILILSAIGFPVPEGFEASAIDLVNSIFIAIGGALAIYGRVKAEKKLSILPKK